MSWSHRRTHPFGGGGGGAELRRAGSGASQGAAGVYVGAGGRAHTRDAVFLRGRGGPLGRLVLSARTPHRALSKRRKRRCNAPHCAFQRVFYDFVCGVFHIRPGARGLRGWGGHAGLPKITTFISSDTGKRKKWQVVF
eukprot:gene8771-biopygen16660